MNHEYRVIEDPEWGYRRLDPIPRSAELSEFYESKYADLIRKGGRAPDYARFLAGGPEAREEESWLDATLYGDISSVLDQTRPRDGTRRALDIGCGTGSFLAFLSRNGWDAVGIESSAQAAQLAKERGHHVYRLPFEGFLSEWRAQGALPFTAVSLLNVLEHVPRPAEFLRLVREVVAPGGQLVVRVPNDYNPLQLAAQVVLQRDPWWIAMPDHVNYFDYNSLATLLTRLEWEILHAQADFPMELFLLMGEDYTRDAELGRRCHTRRRAFELALSPTTRRSWYRALAEAQLGRNCLMIARRNER